VPEPWHEAQRYRALGGEPVAGAAGDAPDAEQIVAFGDFTVRLVTPSHYAARYGAQACDPGSRDAFMGALALRTRALDRVRDCLAAAGLSGDMRQAAARITLAAASAFNAVIEFVESPGLPQ
jgi:hypothetical protein